MADAVLFLHLLGAFLFVSVATVAAVSFEAARRRKQPAEIALLLGLARSGALLALLGMVLVLAFGLWLVHLAHFGYGEGWIDAALGLLLTAVAIGAFGGRGPKRARRLAASLAAEGRPANEELQRLLSDPVSGLANYGSALLAVAIVALMVWKPGASHP